MATEEATKMATGETSTQLEDEKPAQEGEFVGATLQIESETRNAAETPEVEFAGPGLSRNRPGSVIGRQSVRSTSSRTSMRPGVVKSDVQAKTFFSYKVRDACYITHTQNREGIRVYLIRVREK